MTTSNRCIVDVDRDLVAGILQQVVDDIEYIGKLEAEYVNANKIKKQEILYNFISAARYVTCRNYIKCRKEEGFNHLCSYLGINANAAARALTPRIEAGYKIYLKYLPELRRTRWNITRKEQNTRRVKQHECHNAGTDSGIESSLSGFDQQDDIESFYRSYEEMLLSDPPNTTGLDGGL